MNAPGVPPALAGSVTTFRPIPDGPEGFHAVLERMAEVAGEAARTFEADALYFRGEPGAVARGLFHFVTLRVHYVPDYGSVQVTDHLRTPGYLLTEIARHGVAFGDCDDLATLLAALYRACGWRVWIIGMTTAQGDHVALRVDWGEGPVEVDPGVPGVPFGWRVPQAERVTEALVPVP